MPQRFLTTIPRYVDGKFIHASIEYPAEVTFPDGLKIPDTEFKTGALLPIDAPLEERPKLKPPFADVRRGPPTAAAARATGSKRPSDSEPQ